MEYPENGPQNYDYVDSINIAHEEDSSSDKQLSFDPTKTRVARDSVSLDLLISRIRYDGLNLSPNFQRKTNLWSDPYQSRLIESLLIRIPIPAFYFAETEEDEWLVVDGVQRLTAFARFIMGEEELRKKLDLPKLKLRDLEFLKSLEGKTFNDLDPVYQRRILETQVTLFKIEPNTHQDVQYNIFKRINTGGLPLSRQEIRNALNAGATDLLNELADSDEFLKVTNHSYLGARGQDQECVLRFIAFTLSSYKEYNQNRGFHQFLNDTMDCINKMSEEDREKIKTKFKKAMLDAYEIFGGAAFRRADQGTYGGPIYRTLFEVWSVSLAQLSDGSDKISKLIEKKEDLTNEFRGLLMNREFSTAISAKNVNDVKIRFEKVEEFIRKILLAPNLPTQPNPWKNYTVGSVVTGKIINIAEYYGAYVELEKDITGFIHISHLEPKWTERVEDVVSVGDVHKLEVIDLDVNNRRIELSLKNVREELLH